MTKERSMGGNKRSRTKILEIENKIRVLFYSENPRYTNEQILELLQIPKRTYDRYKSKIWREDEPKRKQKRLEMKAKMAGLYTLENILRMYGRGRVH
jgi:hypothetical protein